MNRTDKIVMWLIIGACTILGGLGGYAIHASGKRWQARYAKCYDAGFTELLSTHDAVYCVKLEHGTHVVRRIE